MDKTVNKLCYQVCNQGVTKIGVGYRFCNQCNQGNALGYKFGYRENLRKTILNIASVTSVTKKYLCICMCKKIGRMRVYAQKHAYTRIGKLVTWLHGYGHEKNEN